MDTSDQPVDIAYFEQLGPGTPPAIDYLIEHEKIRAKDNAEQLDLLRRNFVSEAAGPYEWQGRTWRSDRLQAYIADHPFAPRWQYD